MTGNSGERLDCIEVLRGCAVLLVVVHHINGNFITNFPEEVNAFYKYFAGWVGVDLFFAISGFVISRSILPKFLDAKSNNEFWHYALNFWIKRAWRLLPSAWLWLFILLGLSFVFNKSGVFGSVSTNLYATIAGILDFANIRFAHAFGNYFYGASFVHWSLSLEEQFYFFLPLVFFLSRRWFPLVVIVVLFQQLLSTKGLWELAFRMDAILLGVLLALWSGSSSYRKLEPANWSRGLIGLLVVVLFVCMLVIASDGVAFKSHRTSIVALLAIVLVWLASYNKNYILPQGRLLRIMKNLGRLSYAIYLVHIPVFFLIREATFRYDVTLPIAVSILLSLFLTYCIAELNFKFVESPFRKKGADIVKQRSLRFGRSPTPAVRG